MIEMLIRRARMMKMQKFRNDVKDIVVFCMKI